MKTKLEFFSFQLLINFVLTKIFDILIYEIFSQNISKYVELNYFMYSKEIIISLIVLTVTFLFNN